jgi:hypothetical protein
MKRLTLSTKPDISSAQVEALLSTISSWEEVEVAAWTAAAHDETFQPKFMAIRTIDGPTVLAKAKQLPGVLCIEVD